MDIARAMYLGGEFICAHDCDYLSYDTWGLRCIVCGEPVYLKKGEIRKPHFAHIHATSTRQVEECELRASFYGNITQISSFIEDRGQRLEIFQKHFLNMISLGENKIVDDVEFNKWIHSVKGENGLGIDNLTNACKDYFLTHQKQLKEICIIPLQQTKDNTALLQQRIALEAMDYLCVKSSLELLQHLLNYSLYRLYKHDKHKIFQQGITTEKVENICQDTTKLIMFNPWIKVLDNAKNLNLLTTDFSQVFELEIPKIQSLLPQGLQTYEKSNNNFTYISFEYPSTELIKSTAKHWEYGVAVTVKVTENKHNINRDNLYFYSFELGHIMIRNDVEKIGELRLSAEEGLKIKFLKINKKRKDYFASLLENINFLLEVSKNTKYINTELGVQWLIPALKVFPLVRAKRESATTIKTIYPTIEDWIKAIIESESNAEVVQYLINNGGFCELDALKLKQNFLQ